MRPAPAEVVRSRPVRAAVLAAMRRPREELAVSDAARLPEVLRALGRHRADTICLLVYHFRKLEDVGLIEKTRKVKGRGSRPKRMYALTEKGQQTSSPEDGIALDRIAATLRGADLSPAEAVRTISRQIAATGRAVT